MAGSRVNQQPFREFGNPNKVLVPHAFFFQPRFFHPTEGEEYFLVLLSAVILQDISRG